MTKTLNISKKSLSILLSKLRVFKSPKANLEQYPTDSNVAADALWAAFNIGLIKGKKIIDLGAGTGCLGIGCIALYAKKIDFVEIDENAIELLKINLDEHQISQKSYNIFVSDVKAIEGSYDLVVMNPPFGTKQKGTDTTFLEKAFSLSNHVLTFHKTNTSKYIEKITEKNDFKVIFRKDYKFPLKNTMQTHKRKIQRINVTGWILTKNS